MATKKTGSLKGVDVVLITSVNLAADVGASVLPVANGGNGTGSFTDGQILIGQTAGNTLAKAAMSGGATMTAAGVVSVVTNANLTGPITSVGNATSIASQTGTGTKIVVDTSPTLITPVLGVAAATSLTATSTTEQLRLGYDASNYYSTTVSSAGAVTFNAVGASAGFSFSDSLNALSLGVGTAVSASVGVHVQAALTGTTQRSILASSQATSAATVAVYGVQAQPRTAASAFTCPLGAAFGAADGTVGATSTMTSQVGFFCPALTVGGTNNIAFQGKVASGATGGFNLYMDGTAPNYLAGNLSLGTTTASARVHAISTTEQLRLGYDSSNYYSTTVSSGGAVTFDAVGASAGFTFSDAVTARSSLTLGVSSTTTGSLVLCGSGGANTHTITAAANPAATNSYVWPSASPTASQVLTASAPATGVVTLSWATNGVGDVVGPSSSVTGAASVFSGTTGKLLRASPTVTYYSVAAGAEDKIEFGATFKDFRTATDGATVTFDLDLSDQWQVTFAGNRTLAVSNASIGQVITILRYQDATGSRTPTWWANIAWDNGLAPVDDPTASGWSMTVLACVGLDAYSVPNWKEVCRSTSAPLTGITTATDGATVTFDLRVSPRQKVTLAGNRTLALTSGSYYVGQTFDIKLTQDATGSRTVTWWSAIKWTGGTIPTLTTTAGKSDWFRFVCTDASGSPTFDILGTSMNLGA